MAKYDVESGVQVKQAIKSRGTPYERFVFRFNTGGMTLLDSVRLAVLYPGLEPIVVLDTQLVIVDTLGILGQGTLPPIPSFPATLSPYEYTEEHIRWWQKHWHPVDILNLNNRYIALIFYREQGDMPHQKLYLYSIPEKRVVLQVEVPEGELVIEAFSGKLYTEAMSDEDTSTALMHVYRFQESELNP